MSDLVKVPIERIVITNISKTERRMTDPYSNMRISTKIEVYVFTRDLSPIVKCSRMIQDALHELGADKYITVRGRTESQWMSVLSCTVPNLMDEQDQDAFIQKMRRRSEEV